MLDYINNRRISSEIAKKYCEEIHYSIKGKNYFAIAFKNNSDGYEIRNKYFKGSLGKKDITLIDVGSSCINIFEGFFDFLSYVESANDGVFENHIILNSLSNIDKVIDELKRYVQVYVFLDNDTAGKKAVDFLSNHISFLDCSVAYKNYKDLNEFLVSRNKNANKV